MKKKVFRERNNMIFSEEGIEFIIHNPTDEEIIKLAEKAQERIEEIKEEVKEEVKPVKRGRGKSVKSSK